MVSAMDSQKAELDYEFLPFLRAYKDGHIERLMGTDTVPPSFDPQTNVTSKDVSIIPNTSVSVRLYLPKLANPDQKLPLLVYFHGGGFCFMHASSFAYQNHLNTLVSKANVVAVSVDYRLAPEHMLPIAYEDSWAALEWLASHCGGHGPEPWLNEYVDFERVFLTGDSAGANIVHNMAMLAGDQPKVGGGLDMNILGIALIHPYFWGYKSTESELADPDTKKFMDTVWPYVNPTSPSHDDPRINPFADGAPSLSSLQCTRLLFCVAEKDIGRDRGWLYYETLRQSGWKGVAEITETKGEGHVFHLYDPTSEKATDLINRLAAFFNLKGLPPSCN